jgi:hypothetical protein
MLGQAKAKFSLGEQQADTLCLFPDLYDVFEGSQGVEFLHWMFTGLKSIEETAARFELTVTPSKALIQCVVQLNPSEKESFNILACFTTTVVNEFELTK